MKKKGIKSSRSTMFLLVAMVTLTVMTTTTTRTVIAETVDENENEEEKYKEQDETNGSFTVNETGGELSFRLEREKSPHELSITKNVGIYRTAYATCRGGNVKSVSAIFCEGLEVCEEKKSCFAHPKKCSSGPRVLNGGKCTKSGSSEDENENGASSSCLQVEISSNNQLHSGIVQCTSEDEGGLNLTTFDHFTIGHSQAQLLANKNVTRDMIEMKLYVSSLSKDLNEPNVNVTQAEEMVTLFVDEEVTSLQCNAPSFLFHKEQLLIRAHKKDGSILKLVSGPERTSFENSRNVLTSTLTYFRVPEDLVGFSCSAQTQNSRGEWLENRINVKVQGFPLQVMVKSSEGRNMSLNLTAGTKVNLQCGLAGSSQQKERIRNKMVRLNDHNSEFRPVIDFLRFHQVAGTYLICKHPLGVQNSENGVGFIYTFNMAPSAPKIYKPLHENKKPGSSQVHLIYEDLEVVDQTLLCSFNGDPKPVITWMKNGQELYSVKSFATRKQGDKVMPHVKLQVDAKIIHPSDFEQSEDGPENPHVNFSCVATNYFGSDRLDFIFMAATEFQEYLIKPETTAGTNPAETATTFVLVVILLNISFVVLLLSCLIFWKVWKTRRARPCTHSKERTQVFKFQNNSGNDGEESS